MYNDGKGVKQNNLKAVEYYQKACGLDLGQSCFNLGIMYYQGKGVKQNKQQALEYFGKACRVIFFKGCEAHALVKKELNQ